MGRKKSVKKVRSYTGDLNTFLKKYDYQPDLTGRLDKLGDGEFTQENVNEIVLWKTDRYVKIPESTLKQVEKVTAWKNGDHKKGEKVLKLLLRVHGVGLPMASTLLRFRNPRVFQIIDRHSYRAVYGELPGPKFSHSKKKTKPGIDKLVRTYLEYLDDLIDICSKRDHLKFRDIDRILYKFDDEKNGPLK
jgi:hypothetical protein